MLYIILGTELGSRDVKINKTYSLCFTPFLASGGDRRINSVDKRRWCWEEDPMQTKEHVTRYTGAGMVSGN